MQAKATLKFGRLAPRKARYVAGLVRGATVEDALAQLKFSRRGAAGILEKLIRSALANAEQAGGANLDNLWISELQVDGGPTARRWLPRAHGRATRIRKRTAHITVVVSDER